MDWKTFSGKAIAHGMHISHTNVRSGTRANRIQLQAYSELLKKTSPEPRTELYILSNGNAGFSAFYNRRARRHVWADTLAHNSFWLHAFRFSKAQDPFVALWANPSGPSPRAGYQLRSWILHQEGDGRRTLITSYVHCSTHRDYVVIQNGPTSSEISGRLVPTGTLLQSGKLHVSVGSTDARLVPIRPRGRRSDARGPEPVQLELGHASPPIPFLEKHLDREQRRYAHLSEQDTYYALTRQPHPDEDPTETEHRVNQNRELTKDPGFASLRQKLWLGAQKQKPAR